MSDDIHGFVIHLQRATARRPQVERILAVLPVSAEILPASDGGALSEAERAEIYPGTPLHDPAYPFALGPGEIGCFLSHRAAWRAIVARELTAGLIIEDDVALTEEFGAALDLARAQISHVPYIQFQTRELPQGAARVAQAGAAQLLRPQITPLRTSAQLVSRDAAQALLALTARIDRPVDTFVQMRWLTGVDVACVVPSGVVDQTATSGGSTISRKRSAWQELIASVKRTRYRSAVKRLSKGVQPPN